MRENWTGEMSALIAFLVVLVCVVLYQWLGSK